MSSLRRATPAIHRHVRSVSTASTSLIASSLSTDPNSFNRNPNLLRWISAVVAGAGISLYWYPPSTSAVKSVMSFADWLTATADEWKKSYESQPLSSSNFFIRDALRRRIFFNYEKRLRSLSPPEKACNWPWF